MSTATARWSTAGRPAPASRPGNRLWDLPLPVYLLVTLSAVWAARRLTLAHLPVNESVPFFPAAGLAVGFALRVRRRPRVVVAVAAGVGLVAALDTLLLGPGGWQAPLVLALASSAEVALAVVLVATVDVRKGGPGPLNSALYGTSFLVASTFSALTTGIGLPSVPDRGEFMVTWAVGNTISMIVVAPLFFVGQQRWPVGRSPVWRRTELAAVSVLLLAMSVPLLRSDSILVVVPVIMTMFVAVRYGPRGSLPVTAAIAVVAGWYSRTGTGPLATDTWIVPTAQVYVWMLASGVNLTNGQVGRTESATRRLQRTDAARRAAELRAAELGQAARAGVLQVDEHLVVRYCNSILAGFIGQTPSDVIGRPARELGFGEMPERMERAVPQLLGGRAFTTDIVLRHVEGHRVDLFGTMRGQRDPQSGDSVITAVLIEVTRERPRNGASESSRIVSFEQLTESGSGSRARCMTARSRSWSPSTSVWACCGKGRRSHSTSKQS